MKGWGRCLKVILQKHAPFISANVHGGPSGGSSMRRPGSEDPHRRDRQLINCVPHRFTPSLKRFTQTVCPWVPEAQFIILIECPDMSA